MELKTNSVFEHIYKVLILTILLTGVYWLAVRPAIMKKSCDRIWWHQEAEAAQPATTNWPKCSAVNPFDSENLSNIKFNSDPCHGPVPAKVFEEGYRKATQREYGECLRAAGL